MTGGIWNGNGLNQSKKFDGANNVTSLMVGFHFSGVENLVFKPTKILNTKTYGCLFSNVKNLLIENVEIDLELNPTENNDGIHILGNSEDIVIQNCILKSWDNVIALNADDVGHGEYGTFGDIKNVYINNITINNGEPSGHLFGGQGILLLAWEYALENVKISNIKGKATYLAKITTYDLGVGNGWFDNITFEDIELEWVGTKYAEYLILQGAMGTVNLKNIKVTGNEILNTANKGIAVTNGSTTITTIDKLNIDDVDMGGMIGTDATPKEIISVTSAVTINNLKVNRLTSKNNVIPCYPLRMGGCTVKNISLSNFDIDNASKGGMYMSNVVSDKVLFTNIVVDNASDNVFYYGNDSVSNLGKAIIGNCGNINVLTPSKITSLVIDGYVSPVSFIPVVSGTVAGTATYTEQIGFYTKIGKLINFQISLAWTGHTGTSQAKINLPFSVNANNVPFLPINVVSNGITMPVGSQPVALIAKAGNRIQMYTESAGSIASMTVPVSGTLYISGTYVSL